MIKDNFSKQAKTYAAFRPNYPKEVYDFVFSLVKNKNSVWDCGTGNGQMAIELAKEFKQVFATDISQKQLNNAFLAENIHYSLQKAEVTNFTENQFDLITVAQAIHWFDFEKFYTEVNRVAKKDAILFVIGYSMPRFEGKLDEILQNFYWNIVGKYWDNERKMIDASYQTIPFPFDEIKAPIFKNQYFWNIERIEGYLNSWSAVQHFIKANAYNPVDELINELQPLEQDKIQVDFPLFTRIGRID